MYAARPESSTSPEPATTEPNSASGRIRDERGLTLVELMVALLIVGLLVAIALPAFLSRKVGAGDSNAKALMRTAQSVADSYSLERGYSTMTPATLKSVDPSINITANGQAVLVNANPTANGYLLTVVSSSANTFNVNFVSGTVTRSCTVASGNGNTGTNTGGGCKYGAW